MTELDDRSITRGVKQDTKKAIIEAAAPLIYRQGFHRTGLKEILDAAGVPKGSFYFYFKSKEDFGLAVIDHYLENLLATRSHVLADGAPPLERLRAVFAGRRDQREMNGCEGGCPLGNLAQEMSDLSPRMREHLQGALASIAKVFAQLLAQARDRGDLPQDFDPDQTAGFILDAWEGALLRMKTEKSVAPLDRFIHFVFNKILV
nr:TetR/AcrR family transcriptional regulator [Fundidesulfovibrio terrae]